MPLSLVEDIVFISLYGAAHLALMYFPAPFNVSIKFSAICHSHNTICTPPTMQLIQSYESCAWRQRIRGNYSQRFTARGNMMFESSVIFAAQMQ